MFQFPYFSWTTIELGPLTIQVWGMFVALGILLSMYIIHQRAKRMGLDANLMLDMALWVVVFGFVGARLVHVFLYEPSFYLSNPGQSIAVWNGGLSSFGGFIGAFAGFFLFVKKRMLSKDKLMEMAEQLAFASLFGWMVSRVGCAAIHDHWGIPCNCPFAIKTPDGPRLDMAVLEIIFLIPLAIIFFLWRKAQKPAGFFLSILAIYYGILRFFLDFLRATDIAGADVRYFGLTPGQYFAIFFIIWGGYLYKQQNNTK